jgi:O-antigen/teichoic acid export membrane protein
MKKKSLTSNYIFNVSLTVLNLLFPMITFPYVSRVIGVSGVGKVGYVTSIVNYFLIFASLGIPNYGVREIAKSSDDKNKSSKVFSEIFLIGVISSFLSFSVYYIMIFSFGYFKGERNLYIISGLTLILNMFSIDWMYKGFEDYKFFTMRSLFFKVVSIALLFVLVTGRGDYINYALVSIIALSGANIVNIIMSRRHVKFSFKGLKIKRHLTPIMILLSTEIAINIYANLDSTMLGAIAGDLYVGYYTAAIKITKMVVPVVTSLGIVLLPRLSYYIKENNRAEFDGLVSKSIQYILFISLPAVTGLFMLSPEIIRLFSGRDFEPAITSMRICTPIVLFMGLSNLTGVQILIPLGKEKQLLKAVIIAAVTNFILNLVMIPLFKQNGAAISTVVVEFLVLAIQMYYIKDYLKGKLFTTANSKYIIGALIVAGAVMLVKLLKLSDIITVAISIVIGGFMYLIFNIIIRDSIASILINKFVKRK